MYDNKPNPRSSTSPTITSSASTISSLTATSSHASSTSPSLSSSSPISTFYNKAKDQVKRKLSSPSTHHASLLPESEEEFEREKAREVGKEERRAEYERRGLEERVKFGVPGGMSMNG